MKTILATVALMAGQAAGYALTVNTEAAVCDAGVNHQNGELTSYYSTIFTAPDTVKYQLCEEYAVKWCAETSYCDKVERESDTNGHHINKLYAFQSWEGTLGDSTTPITRTAAEATAINNGYTVPSTLPSGCFLRKDLKEDGTHTQSTAQYTLASRQLIRFTYYIVWNEDITVGMTVEKAGQNGGQAPATTMTQEDKKKFKHIGQDDYDKSGTAIIGGLQIIQEYITTAHDMVDDTKWYFWRAGVPQYVSIDAYYAATTCPAQIRNFLRRASLCGTSTTGDCMDTKIEKKDYYAITVAGKQRTSVGGSTSSVYDGHSIQAGMYAYAFDETEVFAGCGFILAGDPGGATAFEDQPYYPLADGLASTTDAEPFAIPFFVKKMKSGSTRNTASGHINFATSRRTGTDMLGGEYSTALSTLPNTVTAAVTFQNQFDLETSWTNNNQMTCRMYCSDAVGEDSKRRFVLPSATDDNYAAQSLCSDCSVADTATSYAGIDPTDGFCKDCPVIGGAVDKSYTCSEPSPNQYESVFVNAQDSDCTDGNEAPYTTYIPHACLPKSSGCPAGFQLKNPNCLSCSDDDALNTDPNCKHKTGCACKFDVNFKSSNSTPAVYELRPTGKCKFKSMNDLFEYEYLLDEKNGPEILLQLDNVTGSSVEEFVNQDYLLRKTTVRVSVKNYDDVVTDTTANIMGYKYYNFEKQQAAESWTPFTETTTKSGKVQDIGTICWIKPSSKNDCIFDPANSCDRDFTKAQYMSTGHNITANGETLMTDDCDIIQFVEPLIDTRAVSAPMDDLWQTELDIDSSGVDAVTIVRGYTPAGDSAVMEKEVETKIAMHKLIGIASECIDSSANTHARLNQPGNDNSENIFSWGDLQAKVKFNMVTKVKLLRSEQGNSTGYIGAFETADATAVNRQTEMFDLLFVSGENIMDVNVQLDGQTGNVVFERLTNGPQSSFNSLLVEHESFTCTTTLDIHTSGAGFDCFGSGSAATSDSSQTQTGGYFHTVLGSDGYYGHHWSNQTDVNNTAEYISPSDWINQQAETNLTYVQPCTATVDTTCGSRVIKVTDNRKCFNFHGMDAGNPIDQFTNLSTANNHSTGIYNLLDATGACEKPKEDAKTVESHIGVETLVVERLRLSTERVFPSDEIPDSTTGITPFELATTTAYLAAHYDTTIGDTWECDDPACTTDPYHVIYYKEEAHDNDATCTWAESAGHVTTGLTMTRGAELLTGCKDNATSLLSDCQSSLEVVGLCTAYTDNSGPQDLYMPPASFPHFYVYAMSTVRAQFPETDAIAPSNEGSVGNDVISHKGGVVHPPARRLGSKKLLASKSKLLASKGSKLTLAKSLFVISDTHILH